MNQHKLFPLFIKWMTTGNPTKKFSIEIQLMKWGSINSRFIRKYFQRRIFYKYNCDVSHSADIHPSVIFPHPTGIVIGSNAIIEKGCSIYQQVTIGANLGGNNEMAHIKSDSKLFSGVKIIGGIEIGTNCVIGANTVVTKDIPLNSRVVGINRILSEKK